MVAFLIPLLAGVGGGMAGTLLGGGKKEIHASQEHYAPTFGAETYSPVVSEIRQYEQSYIGSTYIMDSPGTRTKKEVIMGQDAKATQMPSWNIPTGGSERSESEGLDVTKIAIIAVIGAVAVTTVSTVFSGKGVRRKK